MNISNRVEALRKWMQTEGIDLFIVPTLDPHNSEYVPAYWKCRQWLTGFTGSAGTAVVTATDARLWTDSRYWLQATGQLAGTPFTLMREGEDTDITPWMAEVLRANPHSRIGFAPDMMTPECYSQWIAPLGLHPSRIVYDNDPFTLLWQERPALSMAPAEIMPDEVAGRAAADKIRDLTAWMAERQTDRLLITELSEICWMLNLRGSDIPYNPFVIAFLEVRTTGSHRLFVHPSKITPEVRAYLKALHVDIHPYEEGLQLQLAALREPVTESPVAAWRALKNPAEQEGMRRAHLQDGVAMVRFLAWLERSIADGRTDITEMEADRRLTALRAEQPDFLGLSFETIAAYGPHGAIVHYEASPETDVRLEPRGLFLLDSGGQYACGTTDITRTVALGTPTPEERRVYTLVLKGHLQLAHAVFPDGTTGLQLDTYARAAMWRDGYDYGHGTGHGVGHRLGVHEGPLQIRKNLRACTTLPFHAGQTVTDEPGIYVPGAFGVRIENLLLATEGPETPFGTFLRFDDLTLCPYDLKPVVTDMLTPQERQWLNDYHFRVRETLMPLLHDEADREWLENATRPV